MYLYKKKFTWALFEYDCTIQFLNNPHTNYLHIKYEHLFHMKLYQLIQHHVEINDLDPEISIMIYGIEKSIMIYDPEISIMINGPETTQPDFGWAVCESIMIYGPETFFIKVYSLLDYYFKQVRFNLIIINF